MDGKDGTSSQSGGEFVGPIVPAAEIKKAESILTPKQKAMSEARFMIAGPMENISMQEDEKQVVMTYAQKVGELAGQEFDRVQNESPVLIIAKAMEEFLPQLSRSVDERTKLISKLLDYPKVWKEKVESIKALAILEGKKTSRIQDINDMIKFYHTSSPEYVPTEFSLVTGDIMYDSGKNDRSKNPVISELLHRLGFLPKEATINTLEMLPESSLDWSSREVEDVYEKGEKVMRIRNGDEVIGMKSERLPGVLISLHRMPGGVYYFALEFTAEAINRSITNIPSAEM